MAEFAMQMIFPYISPTPGELIDIPVCRSGERRRLTLMESGCLMTFRWAGKIEFSDFKLEGWTLGLWEKKKISHRDFTVKGGLAGGCHLISL